MKNILFVFTFLSLLSCGATNIFDDNIPYKQRFDEGLEFFEKEKYNQSAQQFNIIVQRASHTDLGDDSLFFLAESYFLNKDYNLALIEFEKLVSRMGFSPYIEKSRWRICETLTFLSPNYFHDQDSSVKAISQIQDFIDDYPNSQYLNEADILLVTLRNRLAKKHMETGKLYIKLKAYDSAKQSYENVVNDYYDTKFYYDANLEIIRCLIFLGEKDEAKVFLKNFVTKEDSMISSEFNKEALDIINNT
jgi:outer membrane protein assembly factor BamD|tara:strand:- start:563 stop:1306 length:744 start_codon:yes stop_codon:yes gene_type:complete